MGLIYNMEDYLKDYQNLSKVNMLDVLVQLNQILHQRKQLQNKLVKIMLLMYLLFGVKMQMITMKSSFVLLSLGIFAVGLFAFFLWWMHSICGLLFLFLFFVDFSDIEGEALNLIVNENVVGCSSNKKELQFKLKKNNLEMEHQQKQLQ